MENKVVLITGSSRGIGAKMAEVFAGNGYNVVYPSSNDYDASKAAIISLTKNMAIEFAPHINVNAIAPGWVDTEMNLSLPKEFLNEEKAKILLNRFAELEEIAELALFLASDKANYINSEVIRIDGGM